MREVIVSEHAGFCFGAGRGVETVEKAIEEGGFIYTFGPILNNAMVVSDFEKKGVKVVESVEELKSLPKGKVIIRSHGVPRATYEAIKATGHELIDATCPFVKRIHNIVEKQSSEGDRIIVIGNPKHPEVIGIVGWSHTGAEVIENSDDIDNLAVNKGEKVTLVSQTTFNRNKFQELVEKIEKNVYNVNCMNTICDATAVRQREARELAGRVNIMIVIGDTHSSNSKKLYEICSEVCEHTMFVLDASDVRGNLPEVDGPVGITAGASTPKYIIEEVQSYVRNDF
ncbi:MAG: 4-hydroxy-3-methylbut-2-enyl diphosphate reductase [Lachnospiraceae bacterium]|nr:4-hydroxy-3-methylbut-2-enyl diphosphate reductase [Lachnospiraceae bacterium]